MDDQALGPDDYKALFGMMMSKDPASQAQAQTLAKKLTPQEQQQFFDFQKSANSPDLNKRADSNIVTADTSKGSFGVDPADLLMFGPSKFLTRAAGLPGGIAGMTSELPAMLQSARGGVARVGQSILDNGVFKGSIGELLKMIGGVPSAGSVAKAGVGLADDAAVGGLNALNKKDLVSKGYDPATIDQINTALQQQSSVKPPIRQPRSLNQLSEDPLEQLLSATGNKNPAAATSMGTGQGFVQQGGNLTVPGPDFQGAPSVPSTPGLRQPGAGSGPPSGFPYGVSGAKTIDVSVPSEGVVGAPKGGARLKVPSTTSGENFIKSEFPPGFKKGDSPERFESLGRAFAEKQGNKEDIDVVQRRINELLDEQLAKAGMKSRMRSPGQDD